MSLTRCPIAYSWKLYSQMPCTSALTHLWWSWCIGTEECEVVCWWWKGILDSEVRDISQICGSVITPWYKSCDYHWWSEIQLHICIVVIVSIIGAPYTELIYGKINDIASRKVWVWHTGWIDAASWKQSRVQRDNLLRASTLCGDIIEHVWLHCYNVLRQMKLQACS